MIIKQSKLFSKARKEAPSEAEAISHKLLTRAGYVQQIGTGLFALLPLGFRVTRKVEQIVREEMEAIDAQEIIMPALQPASLWAESGRLETMDPPLFRLKDRHERELVLAPTHEEATTLLARSGIESYKDLPVAVFQIQTKFRNEIRANGGLLRVREFLMKDLYSFHRNQTDLQEYYEQVKDAYRKIFERCDLTVHVASAHTGTIGGKVSHEFQVECESGEDKVMKCNQCDFVANAEVSDDEEKKCPKCEGDLRVINCVENAHVFQLGKKYSEASESTYTEEDGTQQTYEMGCYGIGIGRLVATIAETHWDEKGLKWPKSVSPFDWHVLSLQDSVKDEASSIAKSLENYGDVLLDDRSISAGEKFAEADLLGIGQIVVVSERNIKENKLEIKDRITGKTEIIEKNNFLNQLGK
jgi:prolyl-tRNA synthetase